MNRRSLILVLPALVCATLLLSSCKDDPPASPSIQTKTLNGVALDEQGYAVPFAIVEALSGSSTVLGRDTTDETGVFAITGPFLAKSTGDAVTALRITHGDFRTTTTAVTPGSSVVTVQMTHVDSACGRLSLLVRELATLAPINGAEVKLKRNGTLIMTSQTDANGRVEFNFLMAGQYSLRIAKPGFAVVERSATVQYCDSTSMDIRMSPSNTGQDSCCNASITLLVRDKNTMAPLVNVQVKLSRPGMDNRVQYTTQNGVFFGELCPGTYGIRIAREGYKVQELSTTLTCNQQLQLDAELEPAPVDSCCNGVITIEVKDSVTGNPIQNATVKLWRNGAIVASQPTNASGLAVFDRRCEGSFGVSVLREGYRGQEANFALGCDGQFSRTFLLVAQSTTQDSCCTASLKLRVLDSTVTQNGWIAGATVTIKQNGTVIHTGTTDIEGWFYKQGLCSPATYQVEVEKTGFVSKSFTFTYTSCILKSETVRLAP